MGRSFFRRIHRGDLELADRDDLWVLLVRITFNKARYAVELHMAAQREVRRFKRGPEGIWIGTDDLLEQIDLVDDEPTPEMAAVLNEAIGLRLRALTQPELRQIAVLNLEGWTNHEIAQELRCTERSIERKLGLIRKRWEQPGRIASCYDRTDPKKGP